LAHLREPELPLDPGLPVRLARFHAEEWPAPPVPDWWDGSAGMWRYFKAHLAWQRARLAWQQEHQAPKNRR
jgi:hypothetical protein